MSQKSGKTLHLLKASSKPIKGGVKRKKVPILGSFAQIKAGGKTGVDLFAAMKVHEQPTSVGGPGSLAKKKNDAEMKTK